MDRRESDWKKFKKLKESALERFCESVLEESRKLCDGKNMTAYEAYLDLYQFIQERDKKLSIVFDGHSRSRADQQLRDMYIMGLITDSELSQFSEKTQSYVNLWIGDAQDST